MKAWRVLVIDDEPPARRSLRVMLETERDLHVVGECETGRKALAAIQDEKPDLIFLDVQMPGLNGFEVLERIPPQEWPRVIFVTAYDQFAVRAFEINAVDYLLKPFDEERLRTALDRARHSLLSEDSEYADRLLQYIDGREEPPTRGTARDRGEEPVHRTARDRGEEPVHRMARNRGEEPVHRTARDREESTGPEKRFTRRLIVRETGRIRLVDVSDIRWIAGAGNLVELHLADEMILHRESMQSLADRLDPDRFIRIHRSSIVCVAEIQELRPLKRGDHEVILRDGTILKLSRAHFADIQRLL